MTMPVLQSLPTVEHVVEPLDSDTVLNGLSCVDLTQVVLENSLHVATLDNDAELIFEQATLFIGTITGGPR
ncbi:hypothetical protein EH165_06165 [Nakamurella antarctica]|uniref:Uncharacterized protein n=1 Tax=Nakamurella antarctica TaxID=1902245 RepID=A0A3G8ZTJ6_9ACTN|nr:hypothetical protein [Nakamurella antarctica]AZI57794.1 hypothetical protein EH165_06165 [Nakamurella antarctica]